MIWYRVMWPAGYVQWLRGGDDIRWDLECCRSNGCQITGMRRKSASIRAELQDAYRDGYDQRQEQDS
jgi:hypothetical protein